MILYKRIYGFKLSFNDYIKLVSIASNLSIDPDIVGDKSRWGVKGIVLYEYRRVADNISIEPIILLYPPPKFAHKRLNLLNYISRKLLSIGGGFRVERIYVKPHVEISESTTLVPHLDIRLRRFAYEESGDYEKLSIYYWFTLLAVIAGLHRWGFAWRRIIGSTYSLYNVLGYHIDNDLHLYVASILEFIFNRSLYRVYGEERYMYSELSSLINKLVDEVSFLRVKYNDLHVLNKLIDEKYRILVNKVSEEAKSLGEEIFKPVEKSRNSLKPVFLGVYFSTINRIKKLVLNTIKNSKDQRDIILFATETWSPIYQYLILDAINRNNINIGKIDIFILYTPQTLPQIIYSDIIFRELIVKRNNGYKIHRSFKKYPSVEIRLGKTDKFIRFNYMPITGKNPRLLYYQLKSIFCDRKFSYDPKLTGITSALIVLEKLEKECLH